MTNGDNLSKWKVEMCNETAYTFVCKKPWTGNKGGRNGTNSPRSSGPGSGTDEDFIVKPSLDADPLFPYEFKGNRYAVMYDAGKVKFVQARMRCENMKSKLASIHSREEVEFLKRVVVSNSTLMVDAWIGLVHKVTGTGGVPSWVDGSPYDYKNFAPLEPKYDEEGDFCGQIMTNGDNLSKWKVEMCNETAYAYVCKKPGNGRIGGGKGSGAKGLKVKPTTDANAVFPYNFKGNKYAIIYRAGKVVFVQARSECQNLHGELASIHSKEEAEFLKSVMQSNGTLMEDAWIGLVYKVNDIDALKTWVDGSPWDYENFALGEPRYQDKGDFCGQIATNGDEFSKWKVVNCREGAHIFVCQERKVDGKGRGSGGGKCRGSDGDKGRGCGGWRGSGSESTEEYPPTRRPPKPATLPPEEPPALPPLGRYGTELPEPESTTEESLPDSPDPDPEDSNSGPDRRVSSPYGSISEYDLTVEEKGCYPV
ncbi:lectin C-type domain protein [Ancylostoma duodenale]|uniref:Lectin C-type domain protein n=1 Tax=Ancylostoma duodenale TaxID=51022 RepID=A0A0C2DJ35_9BILA|nr:lectin C-type domain protein [Ancylostoma duodenale]